MTTNVTLYEAPGVALVLEDRILGEQIISSNPKYSQLMVAAALERELSDMNISFVDAKAGEPTRLEKYEELRYGSKTLEKFRVGVPFEEIAESVESSDIIGVTVNHTYERRVIRDFVRYMKEANPEAIVVLGGSDATAHPQSYLNAGADFCVLGKGEIIAPNLFKALVDNQPVDDISGVAYLKDGQVIINKKSQSDNPKVDSLPLPALHLVKQVYSQAVEGGLPEGVEPNVGVLEMSRGCMNNCGFCATPYIIGKYQSMSVDKVEENLDHLTNNGIKTLTIIDDNLLGRLNYEGGRQELLDIFTMLRDKDFSWYLLNGLQFGMLEEEGNIDTELIDALFWNESEEGKLRGCFRSYIPLEKLTDEGVARYRKLKSYDVEKRIIERIVETHVPQLNFGLLVGMPDESPQSLQVTLQRSEEIRDLVESVSEGKTQTYFLPFLFIPIPGTPDYKKAEQFFGYSLEEHPELCNAYASIIHGRHFTPYEMTRERMRLADRLNL